MGSVKMFDVSNGALSGGGPQGRSPRQRFEASSDFRRYLEKPK